MRPLESSRRRGGGEERKAKTAGAGKQTDSFAFGVFSRGFTMVGRRGMFKEKSMARERRRTEEDETEE